MPHLSGKRYSFQKYTRPDRWASYYYQIREVLALRIQSVLEIGLGEGILRDYLTAHTTISYRGLDLCDDLHPDVVGSITSLPFDDNTFDLVCAFEVLEHVPFHQVDDALSELRRVSNRAILVSIFHSGQPFKVLLKIPFLPEIRLAWKPPNPRHHKFDGEHCWEIGKRGVSRKTIRGMICRHFRIRNEFTPFESPYQHFYLLEKHTECLRAVGSHR